MTDIHTMVGAYVLDAVDDVERAAFRRHLAECAACAREVDELRETAARLADGAWAVPPPRLRTEVLARVARTRQERPGAPGRGGRAGPTRWRTVAVAAVVAVALATGAGVAGYLVQERRLRDERAVVAAARAEVELVRAVLAAPDLTVRRNGLTGGGELTVLGSATRDAGLVLLSGAPAVAADRAYQLWLMEDGTPRPAGLFAAGAGTGTTLLTGLRAGTAVAVTVEPAAGSAAPTMTPLGDVPLT